MIVKTDFETIYRFTAVVLLSLHSKIYLVVERRNSYLQEGIQVGGGRWSFSCLMVLLAFRLSK